MKRILSACLEQTQRFECEADLQTWLKGLERKRTAYQILSREAQPDGSVIVQLKRAYNNYKTGDYFAR